MVESECRTQTASENISGDKGDGTFRSRSSLRSGNGKAVDRKINKERRQTAPALLIGFRHGRPPAFPSHLLEKNGNGRLLGFHSI